MADEESVLSKYDIAKNDESTSKCLTKLKLLIILRSNGVDTTNRRYLKVELENMCTERNISSQTSTNIITPGWVNTPKRLLQMLFERGFIDLELVKKYYQNTLFKER